ncbi:hypothetical protein AtEden1_Chr5g0122731 [Arabidopsis thaliana]
MMSIVFFFLLLLFAVATSDNVINGWYNLTAVHDDEVIWSSFAAPMMKGGSSYITYPVLRPQQACNPCSGAVKYAKKKNCLVYTRCKRFPKGM